MIYNFPELMTILNEEHQDNFVYRGQIKEWGGPLIPTIHRYSINPKSSFKCEDDLRLRQVGRFFIEEMLPNELTELWQKTMTTTELEKHLKRISIIKHMRAALGYPICQILTQQAGINSEGLDVTSDVDVVAFFSIYQFKNFEYSPVTSGIGVIYRFEIIEPKLSWDKIRSWDFYSCPSYLPSCKILKLFKQSNTVDECVESIDEYRNAINWGPFFDLDEIRNNRPFEVIKLPKHSFQSSRVINQTAGLIIPDRILNKDYLFDRFRPQTVKINNKEHSYTEDFAKRFNEKKYYFHHNKNNEKYLNFQIDHYFPEDDIICKISRGWFLTFVQNPFLMIPFFLDPASKFLWNKIFTNISHFN